MAKTYLEINPQTNLVILESQATVGGVWAKERLYPGLKTNSTLGSYGYPDFQLTEELFDVHPDKPITGEVLYQYFYKYAEKYHLLERCRFNTKVESVERKYGGGWVVNCGQHSILTSKLVVSTGMTSEPFIPAIPGSESFNAPIFHVKSLHEQVPIVSKNAKNVVILGGSKSAYDAAYAFATNGVTVDWVIRESGTGPVWMSPTLVTPLKKRLDYLIGVRFLTWLSPCVWGANDGFGGIRNFLHRTWFGRFIVDTFFKILASDVITLSGYDKHPETKKLKPWTHAFWIASSLGIFNYPTDFFQLVRDGLIKVHLADITNLSSKTVHLSNGETLNADALVCSTGWKRHPPIKFLPEGSDKALGLPYYDSGPDDALVAKADAEIMQDFPRLADQPVLSKKQKDLTSADNDTAPNRPFRLYHFMVPPSYINDRSIAFTGMMLSLNTTLIAQVQALWVTAYFNHRLTRDIEAPKDTHTFDEDQVKYETILHTRFCKWRYPGGFGERFPDIVFDAVPYMDMLLRDMSLRFRRKESSWKEYTSPYRPSDYAGVVTEWKALTGAE
jgi:cation diffusion facilitator CzcD-associated flavoprotein CzcO